MKKILSLLALVLMSCMGAWAETVVTNPATEMVDGTYITLQCMDTNGGDEYYFNGAAVKSQTLAYENFYKIVSNGEDKFYLQRVSDSKYVANSNNNVAMVAETSGAAAFTFSIASATGWTTYNTSKYTNGTSTVRFTNGTVFLNTQGTAATPKYAAGTGGFSIWYVKTYTQSEVDAHYVQKANFNYILSYNGVTKSIPVEGTVGQPMPTAAIPSLFTATQPTGNVVEAQTDVTIELTLKDNIMPFQYYAQSSEIVKWYTLKMRDNYWMTYSATGDVRFPLSQTAPSVNDNSRLFAFVGNPLTGFKIISYAEGDYKSVTATTGNNSVCGAADGEEGSVFIFEVNDGKNVFNLEGNAYLNAIGNSSKLGIWNHTLARNDDGSKFTFAETELTKYNLDAAKAEAIAALPNIPALYSASDLTTATNTINAVTCTNDDESIEAAKAAIKAAQIAYLKTAEGKKIAFKSLGSYSTRGGDYYLTAEAAGTQMTSNTELTKTAVYEVALNEAELAYTVKAISNNTYLPKTGGPSSAIATTADAANAGLYTFAPTTNEDQHVVVTNINGDGVSDSQGGIHLDGSKKIVVWGPNGQASYWNIETVSEELWEELNPATATVTYHYTLGTSTKDVTSEQIIGETAAAPSHILFATFSYDELPVVAAEGNTINVTVTETLPFVKTTDPAAPKWGVIRTHSNENRYAYVDEEGKAKCKTTYLTGEDNGYLFYITGNVIDGFQLISQYGALEPTAEQASLGISGAKWELRTGTAGTTISAEKAFSLYNENVTYLNSRPEGDILYWEANDQGSTMELVQDVEVEISAAKYATLYSQYPLAVPSGVKAYTLAVQDDYLQATEVTTIPVGVGVVLQAENAGTYTFPVAAATAATSCLTGTYTEIAKPEGALVLGIEDDVVGFYNYNGENVAANKAYYVAEGGENSNLRITFEDLTSIIAVAQQNGGQAIYDLQGRRVVNAHNGLYIINGKKVIK